MFRLLRLFRTSIGNKLVMALTGGLLIGFLIVHAVGNLAILMGPEALNGYAAWLKGHPLLWFFRVGLAAILVAHLFTAARLVRQNRHARRGAYAVRRYLRTGTAARSMAVSGGAVLLFLLYHLLHLTLGWVGPEPIAALDASGREDVYARIVAGFSDPSIATGYLAALLLLAWHLKHALPSLFQTLGFNHESYETLVHLLSFVLLSTVVGSLALIPLLVLTGWLGGAGAA